MEQEASETEEHIPQVGDPLTVDEIQYMLDAIAARQKKYPEEDAKVSLLFVMLNLGNRYTPVRCIELEWEGMKKDIPKGDGIPKCPNGHVLTEGNGIRLGWVHASPI